ncbi:BQ2448_3629 [Microbotryum intermedium]|uniref:BQ2448_3629 protein n=1 Tax=Microbotryum intermedium TaxID=269621 RepID=A0A238FCF9_9BASI|nr:BQ2448_3629 [Microbotryum intermedium]
MVRYNLVIGAGLAMISAASIVSAMSKCQTDCGNRLSESTDCVGWDKTSCIYNDKSFTEGLIECLSATPECRKQIPGINGQLCVQCRKEKFDQAPMCSHLTQGATVHKMHKKKKQGHNKGYY